MAFYVYLLRCSDGSYYVGHTDNIEARMAQHQSAAMKCYTSTRLPVELLKSESFGTRDEALAAEQQLKGWTRRKKEAWLAGNFEELRRLAKKTFN
ncbi:GIY-YIG nuclease family protein [Herbaspirillum seropedicae]|uniref:GIY-YIG nuclease family protein n=1 Tax=Herbaspirillum seropedicae TaxID=964 RepID=UPI00112271B5|nr:GIY-YIG nuclease family protein [Herbaspirillum seropedicae]QDD63110.1 GIY-YIG nuclease family protein [Herbaspirillum seropedicae]